MADACQVSPIMRGPASSHPWALVYLESRDLLCWLQLVPLLRRQPGEDGLDGSLCSTVETDPRPHSVGIQHSEETPMVKISENTNGNGLSQTIVKTHQVMLA